jgi:hypothetical protein
LQSNPPATSLVSDKNRTCNTAELSIVSKLQLKTSMSIFNKVWKRKVAWRDVSQSEQRRGRYGSTYIGSLYEICKKLGKADLHHAGVDGGGSVSVHVGLAQRLIQNGLLNHDLHSFHVHLQKNSQVQTSKNTSYLQDCREISRTTFCS